jgi:putative phosphoesterase
MRLGLIADTHGKVRAQVHEVFRKVDLILHAGDLGGAGVLEELELLAKVVAVYGNVDSPAMKRRLPRVAKLEVDDLRFVVTHGDQLASREPEALKEAFPDADVIVFGHTHRPLIHNLPDFSVVINPGPAGPVRFDCKPSVAILETEPGIPPRVRIVELK